MRRHGGKPGSRRIRRTVILAAGLGALVVASSAAGQGGGLPDNAVEGFGALRLENEYKLSVPDDVVSALWEYLQTRYGSGIELPEEGGGRFSVVIGDEVFIDRYYDAPDRPLLTSHNGIRHRSRFVTGDMAVPANIGELVQIKLSVPGEAVSRVEVKFPVRHYPDIESQEDAHPLLGIVARGQRGEFQRMVRELGIDPWSLRQVLTLEQRRRRVYLSDAAGPFATLTLDQTSSRRLWLRARFTELELELNEVRYTASSQEERAAMETVTAAVKADLQHAFPGLAQDQTPKYNKAFAALERSSPAGPLIMRASFTRAQATSILGLGGLLLYAIFAVVREHRARRRAPARPPLGPRHRSRQPRPRADSAEPTQEHRNAPAS